MPATLTNMAETRQRERGTAKVTARHRITIPAEALRGSGIEAGDRVAVEAMGNGKIVLTRQTDVVSELAGLFTGLYPEGELDALRDEWD